MKKEIIKEIIMDFHINDLPAVIQRDIELPINSNKIITLIGVRRSGKTYILFDTIKKLIADVSINPLNPIFTSHLTLPSPLAGEGNSSGRKGKKEEMGELQIRYKIPKENILYINFEDERLELKKDDMDLILQSYRELYPDIKLSECFFFFDEIQNIDGWDKFIRRVYENITKNIFITGSNSKLLSKEIATSLRGRTIAYEVFPLSFKEYLTFNNVVPDIYHSKTKAKIVNLFEKFLFEGGFPELVNITDKTIKHKILQEYFNVMLYRDLIERYGFSNIAVVKFFMKRVLSNIASPVSINKIYNELKSQNYKIGKNLLYEIFQAMEDIYFALILKKANPSILKQEFSEKKVYSIDNGLLNVLNFKISKDYGKLLENLIFLELYKKNRNIYFYKNNKECDFVIIDELKGNQAIQVCYSMTGPETKKREVSGLLEVCNRFKLKEGYIITFSNEESFVENDVSVNIIPAYKFSLNFTGKL